MNFDKRLDLQVHTIAKKIEKDFLNSLNPVNSISEQEKFFSNLNKYSQYNPNFEYKQKDNYSTKKDSLKTIKEKLEKGLIDKFILKRIDLLEKEIDLIEKVNTKKFCNASKKQYGLPSKKEVKLAEEILLRKTKPIKKNISPKEIQTELFEKLKVVGFDTSIDENMSSRASVHLVEKKLKINKNSLFAKDDAKKLFAHEVETHIYRYLNGENQPLKIFSLGYGEDFLKTEEGLAVFNQTKYSKLTIEQEKKFARGAYAVNYALTHDFFDTYDEMTKYLQKEEAYEITQRVKRGVEKDAKGAFTKDHCYFTGLMKITDYINKGGKIEDLYYGKISIEEVKIVKKIRELNEPKYLPRYLNKIKPF